MLSARALSVLNPLEDNAAADPVGPVPGYLDLGCVMKLGLSVAVLRVAEGSRGTHADDPDHVLGRFRAGIDPRFDTAAPHAWQVVGAERRVGTDSPVVVDRDVVSGVLVELIRHAIGRVFVGEPDRRMGPIAERLLLRGPAPAERNRRARGNRITARVPEAWSPRQLERTVLLGRDRRLMRVIVAHRVLLEPSSSPQRARYCWAARYVLDAAASMSGTTLSGSTRIIR